MSKRRFFLAVLFILVWAGNISAHTYDNYDNGTGSQDPRTLSFTCGSGTTVLVVGLSISSNSARTGGAPTYNSIAMTQADKTRTARGTSASIEIWYLLNPPTGSAYTISVPNNGALTVRIAASSYKATSGQYSVYDTAGGATDPGTTQTSSSVGPLTVTANGVAVDILRKSSTGNATGNKTQLLAGSGNMQYELLSGTSTTFTYSWSTTGYFATSVVAFKEVNLKGTAAISTGFTGTLTNATAGAMQGQFDMSTTFSGALTSKDLIGSIDITTSFTGNLTAPNPIAADTFEGTGSLLTWTKTGTGSDNKDYPVQINTGNSHVTRDSATEDMQVIASILNMNASMPKYSPASFQ